MIAKSKTGQEIERALDNYKQIKDEIEANPDSNNSDLIKRYLEARKRLVNDLRISVDPIDLLEEKIKIKEISLQNGFYVFDKAQIIQATSKEYRKFLREADYANLDSCSRMEVAKGMLKWDSNIRVAAGNVDIRVTGNDGSYITNITKSQGKKLVEKLNGRLLTTQLMYGLFIPYIKQEAQNGNTEAKATLDEMIKTKAEWLEDLVLGKSRIKIGTKENPVAFVTDKDGRFDRADLNELGYPTAIKPTGEFYHWSPRGDERAVFRDRDSGLSLNCGGGPGYVYGGLGVRVAKFF